MSPHHCYDLAQKLNNMKNSSSIKFCTGEAKTGLANQILYCFGWSVKYIFGICCQIFALCQIKITQWITIWSFWWKFRFWHNIFRWHLNIMYCIYLSVNHANKLLPAHWDDYLVRLGLWHCVKTKNCIFLGLKTGVS